MFKLAKNQTFTRTIKVFTPVDGGHREETFKARFNLLPTDQVKTFNLGTSDGSTEFLKRVIASLDDIVDDNDQPMPYSDELRASVISQPHVRHALTMSYFDAVANDPKAGN